MSQDLATAIGDGGRELHENFMDLSVLEGDDPAGYLAEQKLNKKKQRLEAEKERGIQRGRKNNGYGLGGMSISPEVNSLLKMYNKRKGRDGDRPDPMEQREQRRQKWLERRELERENAKEDVKSKAAKRRQKRLSKKLKKIEKNTGKEGDEESDPEHE